MLSMSVQQLSAIPLTILPMTHKPFPHLNDISSRQPLILHYSKPLKYTMVLFDFSAIISFVLTYLHTYIKSSGVATGGGRGERYISLVSRTGFGIYPSPTRSWQARWRYHSVPSGFFKTVKCSKCRLLETKF